MFNNLYGFSKSNLMNLEEEEELNSNLYNNININEQYNDVIIPKENLFNPLLNNSHIEIKSNSNYEKDKKKMIFYTQKNYQSKKRILKQVINLDNVFMQACQNRVSCREYDPNKELSLHLVKKTFKDKKARGLYSHKTNRNKVVKNYEI